MVVISQPEKCDTKIIINGKVVDHFLYIVSAMQSHFTRTVVYVRVVNSNN